MSIQAVVFGVILSVVGVHSYQYIHSGDCNFLINGRPRFIRHGETFTVPLAPCQVHRCNNGRDSILKEGCNFEGKCRDVGSTFVGSSCSTYSCSKPRRDFFRVTQIRGGCKDYHQRCRRPGETFPYVMRGQYHARCHCKVFGAQTYYLC